MTSSGYDCVTVVTNSDTEEWQAVATVVLLLSQTRTLQNDKQWLRSCYCCHKLGYWGIQASYSRVTAVTNSYWIWMTSSDESWLLVIRQAVTTIVLLLSQTRTLRNDQQWLQSCYCCHKLGHWGMTSSDYDRITAVTISDAHEWQAVATIVLLLSQTRTLRNGTQWLRSCYCLHKLGHWGMTSSGYDRVTAVTNSDTEEWQAVTTIVLLLSQSRTLMNDKQWLQSCYCCHKLGHCGMALSGYDRVTAFTSSDTEEWQAVATIVLLLSQTRTLRNDKQWLRSCYCCHKLGHWGMTSSLYDRVTVVTGVTNSDTEEWQAVATIVLLLSPVSQTRTLRNDKQWPRSCCFCHRCHKLGHWGMTSSGYDRVTVVTNLDAAEWQAVTTIVLLLSQTRTLRNEKQWLRSCYCCHRCHKFGHWGMTSSGYNRVTFVTGVTNSNIEEWQAVATIVLLLSPVSQTRTLMNDKQWLRSCYCCHRCHQLGHWGVTSSDYGRVTVVTNTDTEEWQAVATILLVLSQTRTLRNYKQWLRLCYCCHKLGHWGMTSSGYDRVTVVTNSDTEEWQAVATVVLLLSQTRTLQNDKQWLRSCYWCHKLGYCEWQAVATVVLLLSQTRTLMNNNQWLRSCYCCHKLGHCGMSSSGYDRVTDVTNSDTEEWQAVATIVLLLSQTRTLRNGKQWLRSCYCCHKLGHWGMTSSGYDRVTIVTNLDAAEWQAVTTIVLLLSQTRTLRNDKQWLRSCYFCHRCHKLGHWGMTSSGHDRVAFVTGVTNSDIEEWQAVAKIVLLLSPVSPTRTLGNDKQWLRSCYCCHKCGQWGMPSSGYDHVTVVTGVTNSDIEEWQAVATIVLLLSQTRTLRNDKQWLRSR